MMVITHASKVCVIKSTAVHFSRKTMKTAVLLLTCVTVAVRGLDLPFQKCERSTPNLNECMKSAIQDALPILKRGLPEFQFESIEPIRIESLTIGEGKGAVHVVQNYKNVEIHNVQTAKVERVDAVITDDEFKVVADLTIKDVHMNAQYSLNGNILMLPINGEGDCAVDLEDLKATFTMIGEMFEKDGKKYMELKTFNVSLVPGLVEFNFENLFSGERQLGDEMNKLLNENWRKIYLDVRAAYEEALGAVFKSIANLIFKKIPYDEMF
ncbi:hypothetical protein PPYR_14554 [Photinus pyralis]|uniref:Protein takeout n=1 Tax=Photinus pyralis TaxID=7054 RepID=A0A1Y1NBE3_PHOPY|nr:protein takeout-like [Photinus pyralis]XP_031357637.1 protein takeout-like [Photinus pyralis]KAB0790985.1 hypothetical protein PPYR_02785 [Photinus pyralis]KAB0792595.1 hypothetical protein PPYR_14554 [Photinus pyralis]